MDFTDHLQIKQLIKKCCSGDRKCQQFIYEYFFGKMLAVCMRYANDREQAREILHEAMVKVFTNLKNFEFIGSFEGWVRRIVVNTCIDEVRKNKKYQQQLKDIFLEQTIEEEIFWNENEDLPALNQEEIIELIQQLTPVYRTVFNLYVLENYSHKQIADLLGISVGTSKSNLAKARLQLRKMFNLKFVEIEKD